MTAIGGRVGPLGRRVGSVVALSILFAVAACNGQFPLGAGSAGSARPVDRLHQQAADALARWADAVDRSGGASISFVGDLTSQIGTWEPAVGDNNKSALMAGLVVASATLPNDPPTKREVKWLDGHKVEVAVLSASAALEELVDAAGGDCPDCRPLLATDAQLATGLVETSIGPAEAPIWVFTIKGTSVRVTRVAVDKGITVTPPPWNANDPPVGISIDGATGKPGALELTVSFIGAPDPASKACGADYTGEAVESDLAVVIIVNERRNPTPGACNAMGRTRTAKVTLADPLGTRAILEVQQGLPVPLRAP